MQFVFPYFLSFFIFFMLTELDGMQPNKKEFVPCKIVQGQQLQVSSFEPAGLFYCTGKDDDIIIINALNEEKHTSFKRDPNRADVSFCMDRSGTLFGYGGMLGDCCFVNTVTEKITTVNYSMLFNGYLAFTPNQKYFVVARGASPQSSIKVFGTETGKKTGWMKCWPETEWRSLSVTNDFIAAGSNNKVIWLLHILTNIAYQIAGHTGAVNSVSFSPDGKRLLSASDDTTVKLWDVETRKCLKTFQGGFGPVKAVAWMADGIHFASGTESNCIKIWNSDTQECIQTIWPVSMKENLFQSISYTELQTDMFIQFESTGKYMAFRYAKTGSIHLWKLLEN